MDLMPIPRLLQRQDGKLWHHVYSKHGFIRCSACRDTEAKLSEATKHLEEHALHICAKKESVAVTIEAR